MTMAPAPYTTRSQPLRPSPLQHAARAREWTRPSYCPRLDLASAPARPTLRRRPQERAAKQHLRAPPGPPAPQSLAQQLAHPLQRPPQLQGAQPPRRPPRRRIRSAWPHCAGRPATRDYELRGRKYLLHGPRSLSAPAAPSQPASPSPTHPPAQPHTRSPTHPPLLPHPQPNPNLPRQPHPNSDPTSVLSESRVARSFGTTPTWPAGRVARRFGWKDWDGGSQQVIETCFCPPRAVPYDFAMARHSLCRLALISTVPGCV